LKTVRWSINLGSTEFDVDRNWLTRELRSSGEMPGPDGKYSTQQMVRAIFGGAKEQEARAAKTQQKIDEAAMVKNEREVQEGRLVYRTAVKSRFMDVALRMRQIIESFDLGEARESEIFKALRELTLDRPKVPNTAQTACAEQGG
jgi:hypothetical protein